MKKIKSFFSGKAMRKGGYSFGMIAVVLGIVIMVNLFAAQIPEQYRKIDLSPSDIYGLSDTSKELLKQLDKDVTIQMVGEAGAIDERINQFVRIYASNSSHIHVSDLDPALHPGTVAELGTESGSIYVSCEATGKSRNITAADLIEYTYSYYSYEESAFDAEGQLTSAVYYVTSTESPKLYYTEGHGEPSLSSSVTDMFVKNNLEYASLNLTKEESIPQDCDVLLLYAPQKDLSDGELSLVQNYLRQGGKVTILLGMADQELSNIQTLMAEYGMNLMDGYIADTSAFYQNNYFYIFPEIVSYSGITSDLNSDAMVLGLYCSGMELGTAQRDSISVESFLQTTSNGYLVDGENQTKGTYVIGAAATEMVTVSETDDSLEDGESASSDSLLEEEILATLDVEASSEESDSDVQESSEADSSEATETESLEEESAESEAESTDAESAASEAEGTDAESAESEATESESADAEEKEAKLTVITCAELLNETLIASNSVLDNLTVFMNSITWNLDQVENISIPAKSLEVSYNAVTNGMFWGGLYIVAIPVALVVTGFVIWFRRRRA